MPGSPAQPYYYGIDQLGSVRRVFASTTNAPAYGYDSYGNALQGGASLTDFGYAGLFFHAGSGLYLTEFRAYDPVAGRWLSREPLGESADQAGNLYSYVEGDPINLTDPTGEIAAAIPLLARAAVPLARAAIPLARAAAAQAVPAALGLGATAGGYALCRLLGLCPPPGGESGGQLCPPIPPYSPMQGDEGGSGKGSTPKPDSASAPSDASPAPGDDDQDPQKKGRPRENTRQNDQARDAARQEGLTTPEQREQLKRALETESRFGGSLSYQQVREIARLIKLGQWLRRRHCPKRFGKPNCAR